MVESLRVRGTLNTDSQVLWLVESSPQESGIPPSERFDSPHIHWQSAATSSYAGQAGKEPCRCFECVHIYGDALFLRLLRLVFGC